MALFPPNFSWPRYMGWARALLAAAALAGAVLRTPDASWWYLGALAVYLLYAFGSAFRVPAKAPGIFGLAVLLGDTIYFLILAGHGTDRSLWMVSIYFLFLLGEAVQRHGPPEVILVVAVAAGLGVLLPASPIGLLQRTVVVSGVLACALAMMRQRLQRQVDHLSRELEEAREAAGKAEAAERQRIASDFHDGPLQNFISLQMRLAILRKVFERDTQAGMDELRELQGIAHTQVHELRGFLSRMRPLEVEGANIVALSRRITDQFQKESGIPVTFVGGAMALNLQAQTTQEVLQMLREALHNVQKHAHATRVAVAMERNDRVLEISVDDNGNGFEFAGSYTLEELELLNRGSASLKRRARALNADLVLDSRPGRGSSLKVRVPLQ